MVSLGKKTYKDSENYVSKQLSPEFGRYVFFYCIFKAIIWIHFSPMPSTVFTQLINGDNQKEIPNALLL